MDEITNVATPVAENPEAGATSPTEKLSFNDLLKDPDYQAEFDRKVAKANETAIANAKAKWEKKAEKERSEAEALAKMTEEEKHQHELQKLDAERQQAVAELNAYRLKDEASKIASEKGIDVSLLDLIDYSNATAENVKDKLETIESAFSKAVEKAVNERLKQPRPQEVRSEHRTSEKAFLDEKYKDNPFYKK